MSREAFTFKTKSELERMALLDLNVHIAELRRRASWVTGAAQQTLQQQLEAAVAIREHKRKQSPETA